MANIKTGNGLIHQIDKVLKPASKTVAELISADTRFSIFRQALQATGYYDTINTINSTDPKLRRWFTVLAETNQALLDSGIASFAALRAKYSNTGNPLNPLDSLNIYVKYHIIPDPRYLADIVSASSHPTLAPLEVLASKLDDVRILINELTFNGILKKEWSWKGQQAIYPQLQVYCIPHWHILHQKSVSHQQCIGMWQIFRK